MTRYFEVIRRDGPARLGKLMLDRQVRTPSFLYKDDFNSAGSIFRYSSIDEAVKIANEMRGQKKLSIMPYLLSADCLVTDSAIPSIKIDSPKGIVVNPFSFGNLDEADVYVLAMAGAFKNSRDLAKAIMRLRESTRSDTALYAPTAATPSNLALLIYLGVDLIDTSRVLADALYGRYHTRDGTWNLTDIVEFPCCCQHCLDLMKNRQNREQLVAHNILKLQEELLTVREMIRSEVIREYVERQVRVSPDQTACLRVIDQEKLYLEKRTPTHRHSTFYANTTESLRRVEVTRFAERVIKRYKAPKSDVLLLLPCSARKPYSVSKSHRLFSEAIGSHKRYLHELILTSPLALVPRELETAYPAANYDVPVTGRWDREERAWLAERLDLYLNKNNYSRIIAHLDGELEEMVKDLGIDAVYTNGGTTKEGLSKLSEAINDACTDAHRLPDFRLLRFKALADFYFGERAGEALLAGNTQVKGLELQDETKKPLAMLTINGSLVVSLEGAERLKPLSHYIVKIGDFIPKGSLLAPGVIDADPQIRPEDEIIICGSQATGMGRAKMSGWEMTESRRGVAAELRHIKSIL